MSAVQTGVAVRRPCVRCFGAGEDIISGEVADERSVTNTKTARSSIMEFARKSTAASRLERLWLKKRKNGVVKRC